jgi:P-type Cu+ transporter
MTGVSLADNTPKKEVKDPVCSMTVNPKKAADKATYKGKTYYFCSKEDKELFMKSPEKYVKADDKTTN